MEKYQISLGRSMTINSGAISSIKHVAGVRWIYHRIVEYCDSIGTTRGSHGQTSYKQDYYRIYMDALSLRAAGRHADEIYRAKWKKSKRNRPALENYVICGEAIKNHVETVWLVGNKRTKMNRAMLHDLCEWWDAWEFGDRNRQLLTNRGKRRILAAFTEWQNAQSHLEDD
jgi:hypothetical protein